MAKTSEEMGNDIDLIQDIYETFRIPSECRDHIWATMAEFCLHQLANRKGPFYDAAKREGLVVDIPRSPKSPKPRQKAARSRAR